MNIPNIINYRKRVERAVPLRLVGVDCPGPPLNHYAVFCLADDLDVQDPTIDYVVIEERTDGFSRSRVPAFLVYKDSVYIIRDVSPWYYRATKHRTYRFLCQNITLDLVSHETI